MGKSKSARWKKHFIKYIMDNQEEMMLTGGLISNRAWADLYDRACKSATMKYNQSYIYIVWVGGIANIFEERIDAEIEKLEWEELGYEIEPIEKRKLSSWSTDERRKV